MIIRKYFIIQLFLFLFILPVKIIAQNSNLKSKALEAFEQEKYAAGLDLLKQAQDSSPEDPEIYYYLGKFKHYLGYDSRPLSGGYDETDSDEVLDLLNKAIELNPDYGNAYYFLGAEYGARAHNYLSGGALDRAIDQLKLGRKAGGYPDWLLEYNRNILRSLDKNGILFTGGDAEFNPLLYLQIVEQIRKDVTIICTPLLERYWYVDFIKNKMTDLSQSPPLSITDRQIKNLRPYKWKTKKIKIPVCQKVHKRYALTKSHIEWKLKPDMEHLGRQRPLLNPMGAVITDIIQTNGFKRDVYFTIGTTQSMRYNLDPYLMISGLTYKLTPLQDKSDSLAVFINNDRIDIQKTSELLMNPANFQNFHTVKDHNMPRAALYNNYFALHLMLARYYKENRYYQKLDSIKKMYDDIFTAEVHPSLEKFKERLDKIMK